MSHESFRAPCGREYNAIVSPKSWKRKLKEKISTTTAIVSVRNDGRRDGAEIGEPGSFIVFLLLTKVI
jgi:hypothetical protein